MAASAAVRGPTLGFADPAPNCALKPAGGRRYEDDIKDAQNARDEAVADRAEEEKVRED